jgi:outer membrane protein assembly factor BamB
MVDCLQTGSGKQIWRFAYPTAYKDDFGFDPGPRATPTLAAGKVYTFGAEGQLHCLDLGTGAKLWNVDTKERFQAGKGFFGMACSPLVHDGKVFLNIGGADSAGIVAFDAATGELRWKATPDEASYSSPVPALLEGKPRLLFLTRNRLLSLDPANGEISFEFPWRARAHASVNAASPLIVGDLIFLSASYQVGAALLRARAKSVRQLWASDEALSNHYATSVHRDGFVYGFHGRQEYGPAFRCIELATGNVRWHQESFGAGTVLLAADKLVVLKEDGQLFLVEASPSAYRELGRAQVLPNGTRAYPALADGKLYARSKEKLACIDLGAARE